MRREMQEIRQIHNGERGAPVIFDGDDTLWPTQFFYERAKRSFCDLMFEEGFDREAARAKLAEIDVANVDKLGFSKHRFPLSMKEAYEHFCEVSGRRVERAMLERIWRVGYSVFGQKPVLADGAMQVLDSLERHSCRRYLYTAGDPEVQREKIESLGIAGRFEAIYIKETKDEEDLSQILQEQGLEPHQTWMVGNSLRSDIKPALSLGLRCVWVQGGSWEYDEAEVAFSERLQRVSTLTEALPLIFDSSGISLGAGTSLSDGSILRGPVVE